MHASMGQRKLLFRTTALVVLVSLLFSAAAALKEAQWWKEMEYIQQLHPEFTSTMCPNIPPYGGLKAIGEDVCRETIIIQDEGLPESYLTAQSSYNDSVKYSMPTVDFAKISVPVAIWWTVFTREPGKFARCGEVECFFTANRNYQDHPFMQAFLFYGTDFAMHDLPLPRQARHQWALLHEESPKNNWCFSTDRMMSLFNHTSTFRRESDFPLTTMWLTSLADIESSLYYVPVAEKNVLLDGNNGLAPIAFVQSDCDTPSDRDNLVTMLSKYVKVDSYGKCLHNKDLPEHLANGLRSMDHPDFYRILAKYKFVIAMENAVCDDYITEKFWRAFYVGTVPIVYGSPKIKDFLPTPGSAILVNDHATLRSLVERINHLNSNDAAYDLARAYKHTGVSNPFLLAAMGSRAWSAANERGRLNFITAFECFVCKRLHEGMKRSASLGSNEGGMVQPIQRIASVDHYGCPGPWAFKSEDDLVTKHMPDNYWPKQRYDNEMIKVKIFFDWYTRGKLNFTESELQQAVFQHFVRQRSRNGH